MDNQSLFGDEVSPHFTRHLTLLFFFTLFLIFFPSTNLSTTFPCLSHLFNTFQHFPNIHNSTPPNSPNQTHLYTNHNQATLTISTTPLHPTHQQHPLHLYTHHPNNTHHTNNIHHTNHSYIDLKEDQLTTLTTHQAQFYLTLPKTQRNSLPVQQLVSMVGRKECLYEMVLQFIRLGMGVLGVVWEDGERGEGCVI